MDNKQKMTGYSKQENHSYPVSVINMRSSKKGTSHIVFSSIPLKAAIFYLYVVGLFVLLTLFASCELFSTRDPEAPTGSQTGEDIALIPEQVFSIFKTSLTLRDPDLYLNVISSEFSYAATVAAYPGSDDFFDSWTFNMEDNFIRSLLSATLLPPDSTVALEFTQLLEPSLWADSAKYVESYLLEVHTTRETLPHTYEGIMEVVLKQESDGGWRILSWLDDAGGPTPTFSQLRAQL